MLSATGTVTIVKWSDPAGNAIVILDHKTTVKGFMPGVRVGSEIQVQGKERDHPKFGMQIEVASYRFTKPGTVETEIMDVLEFLHDKLELKKRGEKIFEVYGVRAKEIILANPYQIIDDVPKVGFQTADEIADKLGISGEHPKRLEECVLHVLKQASENEGHVFLGLKALTNRAIEFTASEDFTIAAAIERLKRPWHDVLGTEKKSKLVTETTESGHTRCYLRNLHSDEVTIGNAIAKISNAHVFVDEDIDEQIAWFESLPPGEDPFDHETGGIALSEEQRQAVKMALTSPCLIITGGPGVGKTTIIKAIVKIARKTGKTITLTAPTGRAAKRMEDMSGHESGTIHRILQYNPVTGAFAIGPENPLPSDIVICDETSMVDVPLAAALTSAIRPGTRFVLVGDVDQLPPVGPGAFLRDVIASDRVPIQKLTKIYRQKEGSLIIEGSRKILQREEPEFSRDPSKGDLFRFTFANPDKAATTIVELVTSKIPKLFEIETKDIQVICPIHKGPLGVDNLNKLLQKAIQGYNPDLDRPGQPPFVNGDRVIQSKNNYDVGGEGKFVMNGDIGYVQGVETTPKGQRVVVEFSGASTMPMRCRYTINELHELKLAYAVTIHKMQGSEQKAVILIADNRGLPHGFYNRNMLYTAATRGRNLVVIMTPGDGKSFGEILATEELKRNTILAQRIQQATSNEYMTAP
jgi:exodeoxyribonuclease V alpha subunit